jgi:hypothetical protein
MIFNAATKNLTFSPAVASSGYYTLLVTFTSDYDGLDLSTLVKKKSHKINISQKSLDCSALSLKDLIYFLGETITLTLPACTVTQIFCSDNIIGTLTAMDI